MGLWRDFEVGGKMELLYIFGLIFLFFFLLIMTGLIWTLVVDVKMTARQERIILAIFREEMNRKEDQREIENKNKKE